MIFFWIKYGLKAALEWIKAHQAREFKFERV
jgi:hypothetical protein